MRDSLLSPRDLTLALGQLALGAVIGACIGLFVTPSSSGGGQPSTGLTQATGGQRINFDIGDADVMSSYTDRLRVFGMALALFSSASYATEKSCIPVKVGTCWSSYNAVIVVMDNGDNLYLGDITQDIVKARYAMTLWRDPRQPRLVGCRRISFLAEPIYCGTTIQLPGYIQLP
jgi:hypothetical protein